MSHLLAGVLVTLAAAQQATTQFTSTLRDSSGNLLLGRAMTWTSSDPTVASVSSSGLVTGGEAGTAIITATSEGQTAVATLIVSVVPVANLTVTPGSANLPVGGSTQLTVTPRDSGGNVLMGRTINWASSNPAAVSVSSSGLMTRVGEGDRKSTRLNSSHGYISYAVFCLKKKKSKKELYRRQSWWAKWR